MPLPMPTFLMPQAMPANFADLYASFTASSVLRRPNGLSSNLAGGERFARLQNVAIANVVAVDADLLGQPIEQAFDRERRLIRAEAAHRAAGRVVRVDGERFHVDRRHAIRPGAMPAGALQHLRADRRIRALVADDARLHGRDAAFGIATDLVLQLDRVPLRMNVKTFGPRERELDRPAGEPGHERRLRLDRHVLLAAERAAVAHQLGLHAVALDARARTQSAADRRRRLVPACRRKAIRFRIADCGLPDWLPFPPSAIRNPAIPHHRNRNARFRLQKQMLNPLRVVRVFNDMGRPAESFFDVAALELRFAEQVRAALRMNQRRTRLERRVRIGHRLQHFVFDVDQLGRLAGQPLRIGHDAGDDVAPAACFFADRHEHRPVFFDEADVAIARHIGRRDHAVHARRARAPGSRSIDSTFARG